MLCGCKSLLLSSGIRAHVVDPNTRRFDTSGLCLKYASKGVFPFIYECGNLFRMYAAEFIASSHKFASNFFDSNIQVVISLRDRFFLSATLFCWGV